LVCGSGTHRTASGRPVRKAWQSLCNRQGRGFAESLQHRPSAPVALAPELPGTERMPSMNRVESQEGQVAHWSQSPVVTRLPLERRAADLRVVGARKGRKALKLDETQGNRRLALVEARTLVCQQHPYDEQQARIAPGHSSAQPCGYRGLGGRAGSAKCA